MRRESAAQTRHAGAAAARSVLLVLTAGVILLVATGGAVSIDDLRRIEGASTVTVTTIGRTSGKPRQVTVWFVHDDGRLYLQSGKEGETHWYRNLLKTPEVTLDFASLVVRGRARFIKDSREVTRVHDLFRRKYLTARIMSWLGRGGFGQGKVVSIESLEVVSGDSQDSLPE